MVARNPMRLLQHDDPMHVTERPDNTQLPAAVPMLAMMVTKQGMAIPGCNPTATRMPKSPTTIRLHQSLKAGKGS